MRQDDSCPLELYANPMSLLSRQDQANQQRLFHETDRLRDIFLTQTYSQIIGALKMVFSLLKANIGQKRNLFSANQLIDRLLKFGISSLPFP
jgi:hypothetical protein